MNIVIPMAGRGSRLASHQSGLPKPLIEIRDRPLWSRAVHCLPLEVATAVVFVCLQEHLDTFDLERTIRRDLDGLPISIVALDHVTDGQLRTIVASSNEWDLDSPLLIFNADTWFEHDQEQFVSMLDEHDGLLGVADKPGDRWSFARVDDDGLVVEVAEKKRISNWACTGLYYFRNPEQFVLDAQTMFDRDETTQGEYFVAPLYQHMIARNQRIGIAVARSFLPLGTPEELQAFEEFLDSST